MNDQPTSETDAVLDRFSGSRLLRELTDLSFKLQRERDEARQQIDNIRKMLSESGEAVGNGEHNYSIIDMIENLIKSKDYFVRKSDSLERERDEARADAHNYKEGYHIYSLQADSAERERDEAHSILEQVTDRLEQATIELIKSQSQRDEARDESLEQARLLGISGEWGCKLIAERDELQKKYDKLATENMLEVNKICNQRDAAMDVLSKVSHFLSCGIGDENTTAKEFGDRIIDGFVDISNRLGGERDLVEAEKTNLIKELKEAWFAMDEIEGTDRINKWQNKNAHLLGKA